MLVTERAGRMHLVEDGRLTRLSGLPAIAAQGQGGLLDVQLHPDYEANGWIYFTYSEPGDGGAGTALARARLDGTALTDLEVLYTQARKTGRGQHFGSRIGFLGDGTVLFTIGDRGEMERAQDLRDSAGSTIRVTEDGGIPADNPFVGRDGRPPGALHRGQPERPGDGDPPRDRGGLADTSTARAAATSSTSSAPA
jgi:aldose sugar dehydrogenase